MRPITCPFNDFAFPPGNSWKPQPLGARKRSSFNIASAFARSKRPSSNVHKPIPCIRIFYESDAEIVGLHRQENIMNIEASGSKSNLPAFA